MTTSDNPAHDELIDAVLDAGNVLLRVAARSVIEVEDRVTTPQLRVLVLIARGGAQSLGSIAAELAVHASNASRTCDRLVQRGYVTRGMNDADRRVARFDLTPAGRILITDVIASRQAAIASLVANIPEERRTPVLDAFRVLALAAGHEATTDGRFALKLEG